MKIGIRCHDIGCMSVVEEIKSIKKSGFSNVQLVPIKAFNDLSDKDGLLTEDEAIRISNVMKDNDINATMIGAYFNPVHSNKIVVDKGVKKFSNYLRISKYFNDAYVGSETGSFNDDEWTYNPLNRTNDAYQEVLKVFKHLNEVAIDNNSKMAIEGSYSHVVHSPEVLRKLLDDLDSKNVYVILDLFNYLDITNYHIRDEIFDRALELFKDRIVIFHCKDFIVKEDKLIQVSLGDGLMNYPYYIKRLKEVAPNVCLIFEEITGDNIKRSLAYIKGIIE